LIRKVCSRFAYHSILSPQSPGEWVFSCQLFYFLKILSN